MTHTLHGDLYAVQLVANDKKPTARDEGVRPQLAAVEPLLCKRLDPSVNPLHKHANLGIFFVIVFSELLLGISS